MKNKRVKENKPEWFNDDIKVAIKQRDFNHKSSIGRHYSAFFSGNL